MAKKGQAVQLQQELSSDEDWDKMLQRDGLIGRYANLFLYII